jgi:Kef-type K+ transport system membrane component KefB
MDDFLKTILHEFNTPFSSPVLVFSVLLLIVLIFPLLLKKINIPGIIGLIIAGVFIGPYGLNMIEKNSAIDLFSTIGLLYIMFIAGLELDLNEFIRNKNKSIVFGLLTFVVPLAIGFPVCYYFLAKRPIDFE